MKEVFEKIVEILENKANEAEKDMQLSDSYADAQAFGGKQEGYENAIKIVKQAFAECSNGHFGCNTNGEHEKCDGCGLTDCNNRNKIWFGAVDDVADTNVGNNGWIPCSERFPEICGYPVLLTVENKFGQISICKAFTNYMKEGKLLFYTNEKEYCTELSSSKLSDSWKPIAWQPLPDPYNPNACKDTNSPYNDGNECPAADGCAGYDRKRTNFDMCCESMEAMEQIIDIAKIGWTKEQIMEWLKKEECELPE